MRAWLGVHSLTAAGLTMAARSLSRSQLLGDETTGVVERFIRRASQHPDFDASTFRNDIAVLEMEAPVKVSPLLYPICLPVNGKF